MTGHRVVITGVGCVSPFGLGVDALWDRLSAGESAARPITCFDASAYSTRIACELPELRETPDIDRKTWRRLDLNSRAFMLASDEALAMSGVEREREDPTRMSCIVGTSVGSVRDMERNHTRLLNEGPRTVSPFLLPQMMPNAAAAHVAMRYGIKGACFTASATCASAAYAIGLAFNALRSGDADLVIAGGAEASLTPLFLAAFCALKALSQRNDEPRQASRPFDAGRDGFVLGEGAGALVLESLGHALARNAEIIVEVVGFGATEDAHHITAPDGSGDGAARAMTGALATHQIDPSRVGYINAHGTGTVLNDRMETLAIRSVFGPHADDLCVSSTKSMIGHLLGAAAAVETIVTALSIKRGIITPTINQLTRDPACDLDYVANEAREKRLDVALCNAFGFGGHNASLALAAFKR